MMRILYRLVLCMHPPAFRRSYGEEMLWLFDEMSAERGTFALLRDGIISLVRQWFLRSRLWLVAIALAGALIPLMAGNVFMHFVSRRVMLRQSNSPQEVLMLRTALALLTVVMVLIAAVLPLLRIRRRHRA